MSGVLSGGWEYVWAAYAVTAAALVAYTVSLLSRVRRADARRRSNRAPEVTP
jgi:hypothetical protein